MTDNATQMPERINLHYDDILGNTEAPDGEGISYTRSDLCVPIADVAKLVGMALESLQGYRSQLPFSHQPCDAEQALAEFTEKHGVV